MNLAMSPTEPPVKDSKKGHLWDFTKMISITQVSTTFTHCLYFHPTRHLLHNEETIYPTVSQRYGFCDVLGEMDMVPYLTQSITLPNSPLDLSISPKFLLSYILSASPPFPIQT